MKRARNSDDTHHHGDGNKKHLDQRGAFLAQDVVDVAAFGRDQQHAIDRLEPLNRNGHGKDQLVQLVDALGGGSVAAQRRRHFAVDAPIVASLEIGLKRGERPHAHHAVVDARARSR